MENFELALRIAAFVGIGLFLWSAASSLEQIARGLSKLSERGLYVVEDTAHRCLQLIAKIAVALLAKRKSGLVGWNPVARNPADRSAIRFRARNEPLWKRVLFVFRIRSRATGHTELFELREMLHRREGLTRLKISDREPGPECHAAIVCMANTHKVDRRLPRGSLHRLVRRHLPSPELRASRQP